MSIKFRIEVDEMTFVKNVLLDVDFWVGTDRVGFVRLRENHRVVLYHPEDMRRAVDAYLRV